MPYCTGTSGNRLWYQERGAGRPIVLLHGWCMSSAVWELQLDALSGSNRVIAVDLPGHGQSDLPAGGFTLQGCAAALNGLFETLDLRDALLVGWSLGSMVAIESCVLLSGRLSALALVAATPRFTRCDDFPHGLSPLEVEGMARKVQRSLRRALDGFTGRMFTRDELADPALAARITGLLSQVAPPATAVALQALDVLSGTDLRECLEQVTLPAMIICGDSDVICLPKASEFLAERMPSAVTVVFHGCGHAPFLTESSRFNACLDGFRGKVSGDDR